MRMLVLRVLKNNGDQAQQALGRSRGGYSTKIHVTVDGLGNPLRLYLTAGQRHDIIKQAHMRYLVSRRGAWLRRRRRRSTQRNGGSDLQDARPRSRGCC